MEADADLLCSTTATRALKLTRVGAPSPPSPFLLPSLAGHSGTTAFCGAPVAPNSCLSPRSKLVSSSSLGTDAGSAARSGGAGAPGQPAQRPEHVVMLEEALARLRAAENRANNLEFLNSELQGRLQSVQSQLPAQELAYQQLQERFLCMQSRWHEERGCARLQVQELQTRLAALEAALAAADAIVAAEL